MHEVKPSLPQRVYNESSCHKHRSFWWASLWPHSTLTCLQTPDADEVQSAYSEWEETLGDGVLCMVSWTAELDTLTSDKMVFRCVLRICYTELV